MTDRGALAAAVGLILLLSSIAAPAQATAQDGRPSGFWVELGLGPSVALVACTDCEDPSSEGAGTGYVRVGGTVASDVLLGAELATHSTDVFTPVEPDEAGRVEISNLSAVVLWTPWRRGFVLKGGVGAVHGRVTLDAEGGTPVSARETGAGLTFGVGGELPVHRRIALSVHGATWISALGDVVLDSRRVEDVIATTYGLTLGLRVW